MAVRGLQLNRSGEVALRRLLFTIILLSKLVLAHPPAAVPGHVEKGPELTLEEIQRQLEQLCPNRRPTAAERQTWKATFENQADKALGFFLASRIEKTMAAQPAEVRDLFRELLDYAKIQIEDGQLHFQRRPGQKKLIEYIEGPPYHVTFLPRFHSLALKDPDLAAAYFLEGIFAAYENRDLGPRFNRGRLAEGVEGEELAAKLARKYLALIPDEKLSEEAKTWKGVTDWAKFVAEHGKDPAALVSDRDPVSAAAFAEWLAKDPNGRLVAKEFRKIYCDDEGRAMQGLFRQGLPGEARPPTILGKEKQKELDERIAREDARKEQERKLVQELRERELRQKRMEVELAREQARRAALRERAPILREEWDELQADREKIVAAAKAMAKEADKLSQWHRLQGGLANEDLRRYQQLEADIRQAVRLLERTDERILRKRREMEDAGFEFKERR